MDDFVAPAPEPLELTDEYTRRYFAALAAHYNQQVQGLFDSVNAALEARASVAVVPRVVEAEGHKLFVYQEGHSVVVDAVTDTVPPTRLHFELDGEEATDFAGDILAAASATGTVSFVRAIRNEQRRRLGLPEVDRDDRDDIDAFIASGRTVPDAPG